MADDYVGLRTAIQNTLAQLPGDKGIFHNNAQFAEILLQVVKLFRTKCAEQGITI